MIKPEGHKVDCMCDRCIQYRVVAARSKAEQDEAQREYEKRRGAPIGSVSVSDALKSRS